MGEEVRDVFKGFGLGIIVIKAIKSGSLSFDMCAMKNFRDVSSILQRKGRKIRSECRPLKSMIHKHWMY